MNMLHDIKRSARLMMSALALASALTAPVTATCEESSQEDVRRVGALMARGQWKEAIEATRNAHINEATRASLLGIIAMRAGAHERAVVQFEQALKLGPPRELLFLYLAWSRHAIGQHVEARAALKRVTQMRHRVALYWLLVARIARDDDDPKGAYALLLRGLERFPRHPELHREIGFVLLEFHAPRQARRFLLSALRERGDGDAIWNDTMRVVRVLSDRGDYEEALWYVGIVRAMSPTRAAELDALAGHLHARAGRSRVAASLFVRATLRGGTSYAFEAADQYRVAGRTRDALRWNQRVRDVKRRSQQRFLILTEGAMWGRASVVGAALDARDALTSDALRYRYGLALVLGARDFEEARRQAARMGAREQAQRLRELITRCVDQPRSCQ